MSELNSDKQLWKRIHTELAAHHKKQLKVIKRGNHDEIMALIANFPLLDEEVVALVKRGNHEEIMAYISNIAHICIEAEIALFERGNYDEITAYLNNSTEFDAFKEEDEAALIDHCKSHEALMTYISQNQFYIENEHRFLWEYNIEDCVFYVSKHGCWEENEIDIVFRDELRTAYEKYLADPTAL